MDVILAVVCLGLLAIVLLYAGQQFAIPGIVSFLLIGILAGPYALSIVEDQSTIETIGEIGVILLLFTIGLEFSFEELIGAWRVVIFGGVMQVVTTIVAASALMYFARGLQFQEAIFFGFLVSLTSTAIVMKILQERGDVETVSGRTLLGILIFQDLAIIPMILLTPIMMGTSSISSSSLPYQAGKVVLIFIDLCISAHWIVPWVLHRVTEQRSRELFIFTVAGICFTVAWLTNMAGLSYSLGAFVAGFIIGESGSVTLWREQVPPEDGRNNHPGSGPSPVGNRLTMPIRRLMAGKTTMMIQTECQAMKQPMSSPGNKFCIDPGIMVHYLKVRKMVSGRSNA